MRAINKTKKLYTLASLYYLVILSFLASTQPHAVTKRTRNVQ